MSIFETLAIKGVKGLGWLEHGFSHALYLKIEKVTKRVKLLISLTIKTNKKGLSAIGGGWGQKVRSYLQASDTLVTFEIHVVPSIPYYTYHHICRLPMERSKIHV